MAIVALSDLQQLWRDYIIATNVYSYESNPEIKNRKKVKMLTAANRYFHEVDVYLKNNFPQWME